MDLCYNSVFDGMLQNRGFAAVSHSSPHFVLSIVLNYVDTQSVTTRCVRFTLHLTYPQWLVVVGLNHLLYYQYC